LCKPSGEPQAFIASHSKTAEGSKSATFASTAAASGCARQECTRRIVRHSSLGACVMRLHQSSMGQQQLLRQSDSASVSMQWRSRIRHSSINSERIAAIA
jgi:hypothetical protein